MIFMRNVFNEQNSLMPKLVKAYLLLSILQTFQGLNFYISAQFDLIEIKIQDDEKKKKILQNT